MLTKIPHFKEVIISSFNCEGCGFENREIKSGGRIQEKGHKLTLSVTGKKVNINHRFDLDYLATAAYFVALLQFK